MADAVTIAYDPQVALEAAASALLEYYDGEDELLNFTYMEDGFEMRAMDAVNAASEADAFGPGVRLHLWLIHNSYEGTVDGCLVTVDMPGHLRYCTNYIDLKHMTSDRGATGRDAITALLASVVRSAQQISSNHP